MENLPLDFTISSLIASISLRTLAAYGLAILMSIAFAVALSVIYRVAFFSNIKGIEVDKSFPLLAPAVTTIFLVIQFSLPLSLGLLGALSFVRFRTPIKEPEEIGFILILISTSLACAVFKFELAFILLGLVLLVVLLRKSSSLGYINNLIFFKGNADIFVSENLMFDSNVDVIKNILASFGKVELASVSSIENIRNYHYKLLVRRKSDLEDLSFVERIQSIQSKPTVNVIIK